MWPRKYGWLNFAILECSLNVLICSKQNRICSARIAWKVRSQVWSFSSLPKMTSRMETFFWRKFQASISSTSLNIFLVKSYKRNQWKLPNLLAYIWGIFDGFFKAGLVPLTSASIQFNSIFSNQGCARLMSRESNLTRLWLKWVRVESAVKIKDMSRVRVESRWSSFESELSQLDTAWVKVELMIFRGENVKILQLSVTLQRKNQPTATFDRTPPPRSTTFSQIR